MIAEAAPEIRRGGNLVHARNIRIPHDQPCPASPGIYDPAEFQREMMEIAGPDADPALIGKVASLAGELATWLPRQGVIFQTQHIPFSRRTSFFLGGGKAVANQLYGTARSLGIDIRYDMAVDALDILDPPARAVIVCSGGGQASAGRKFINRGTPHNTGCLMQNLIRAGAVTKGEPDAAHLVAIDARSPAHDGGIVTRMDGMKFGMVVDHAGRRFVDETTISGSRRYTAWGRAIASLTVPRATLILDAEGMRAMPVMAFPPLRAETLTQMATGIGVDAATLLRSAEQCGRVKAPSFFAYPMTPGLTFTCHGLHVDPSARVKMRDGTVRQDLFAAGSVMAAGVLDTGYLSGVALTIAAVFGRIAGEEAARHALG